MLKYKTQAARRCWLVAFVAFFSDVVFLLTDLGRSRQLNEGLTILVVHQLPYLPFVGARKFARRIKLGPGRPDMLARTKKAVGDDCLFLDSASRKLAALETRRQRRANSATPLLRPPPPTTVLPIVGSPQQFGQQLAHELGFGSPVRIERPPPPEPRLFPQYLETICDMIGTVLCMLPRCLGCFCGDICACFTSLQFRRRLSNMKTKIVRNFVETWHVILTMVGTTS
ncbi:unnamed protein product [Amoebophrya sp. A120]|nr:unnamed protein product [Amoebophrya sp. A120]|eukprot:GSA120T00017297001.1